MENNATYACRQCKEVKPVTAFSKRKNRGLGHHTTCKPCRVLIERKRRLQDEYDVTVDKYNEMLIKQDGKCAICKTTEPGRDDRHFSIDHDHKTGKVRGLLCVRCNRALGLLGDNVELLSTAIDYLK